MQNEGEMRYNYVIITAAFMAIKRTYIKNVLIPGLLLSGITGVLSGALIFFYKWGADFFKAESDVFYAFVAARPAFVPLLIVCMAALGAITALLIKGAPAVRGGGIPTAEGIVRGLLTFKWLRTLVAMLVNSFIGFFAGLPLGNEGPSVLMSTAVGRGAVSLTRRPAWDRYVMTGGAAAGFAVATGAPLTGVIFALEEAHKRFSPMILMVALSSVTFAFGTAEGLALLFHRSVNMFGIEIWNAPPLLHQLWIGPLAGVGAAIAAAIFIKCFSLSYKYLSGRKLPIPHWAVLAILFAAVAAVAIALPLAAGSGHGLIEALLERKVVWGVILALLAVKIVLITVSGGAGATGGLFIPVLTVGALTGALLAELAIALGAPEAYYAPILLITVAAFLGGTLRAPVTAIAFFIEALGGIHAMLPACLGVLATYAAMELLGIKPLYDIVLDSKLENLHRGKTPEIVELSAHVRGNAFVVGKTTRDVFWPPSCLVLSVTHPSGMPQMDRDGEKVLRAGDAMRFRVETFDRAETVRLLSALVGEDPAIDAPAAETENTQ